MQQAIEIITSKLQEFGVPADILSKVDMGSLVGTLPNVDALKNGLTEELTGLGLDASMVEGAISQLDLGALSNMIPAVENIIPQDIAGMGEAVENVTGSIGGVLGGVVDGVKDALDGMFGK